MKKISRIYAGYGVLQTPKNNYISKEQYNILDEKFCEIIKMLYGYIKRLKSNLDNESDAAEP